MLGEFWKGVSGKAAEHAVTQLLTPASLFWLAGTLAWFFGDRMDEVRDDGLITAVDQAVAPLTEISTGGQIALAVMTVGLVTVTAIAAERATLPVLRFLEGYWPRGLGAFLRRRAWKGRRDMHQEWSALLAKRESSELTLAEEEKHARLEIRMRDIPGDQSALMPTRAGNILRGAEIRPKTQFGLDPILCWPFLWPLLQDADRSELAEARRRLDVNTRAWLFAILSVLWTPFWWVAAPIALVLAIGVYYGGVVPAARNFAVLMEATFTVRRFTLYEALRLEPPKGPDDEADAGAGVTSYLWYGQAAEGKRFVHPPA